MMWLLIQCCYMIGGKTTLWKQLLGNKDWSLFSKRTETREVISSGQRVNTQKIPGFR